MTNDDSAPELPVVQNIRKWLESQGYPLELKVAKHFRGVGAKVIQSEYYQDPEEGVSREIDVSASWSKNDGDNIARVTLAVECKLSPDKPWVIFSSGGGQLAGPARVVQRAATKQGDRFLDAVKSFTETQSLPLFRLPERVGYGLTQTFAKDNIDAAFKAIMSAAKAASAMATKGHSAVNYMEIIFPTVVIDGRLFEYFLSESNDVEIHEVDRAVLVWRRDVVHVHTILHIVTAAAIDIFARDAAETAEGLLTGAFAHEFWTLNESD